MPSVLLLLLACVVKNLLNSICDVICLFEFNVFLQKFSYQSAACVRYNDYDNNSDENDMNIHSYNTNSNYYVIKNSQLC